MLSFDSIEVSENQYIGEYIILGRNYTQAQHCWYELRVYNTGITFTAACPRGQSCDYIDILGHNWGHRLESYGVNCRPHELDRALPDYIAYRDCKHGYSRLRFDTFTREYSVMLANALWLSRKQSITLLHAMLERESLRDLFAGAAKWLAY